MPEMGVKLTIKSVNELIYLRETGVFEKMRRFFYQHHQGVVIFQIEDDRAKNLQLTIKNDNFEKMIHLLEEICNTGFEPFISELLKISREGKKKVQYDGVIIEKIEKEEKE